MSQSHEKSTSKTSEKLKEALETYFPNDEDIHLPKLAKKK